LFAIFMDTAYNLRRATGVVVSGPSVSRWVVAWLGAGLLWSGSAFPQERSPGGPEVSTPAARAAPSAIARVFERPDLPPVMNDRFRAWLGSVLDHERSKRVARQICHLESVSADTAAGRDCRILLRWGRFIDGLRGLARAEQVRAVQMYVNSVPYVSDRANYGRGDHWAPPREFFRNGGDCEDYAVAKYLALRELGLPADDIRIVVGRMPGAAAGHALVVIRHGETPVVLDSEHLSVRTVVDYAGFRVAGYLNEDGWWLPNGALPMEVAAGDAPRFPLPELPPCGLGTD
jgi:predicted transglutaminase-like cysteine proteinase